LPKQGVSDFADLGHPEFGAHQVGHWVRIRLALVNVNSPWSHEGLDILIAHPLFFFSDPLSFCGKSPFLLVMPLCHFPYILCLAFFNDLDLDIPIWIGCSFAFFLLQFHTEFNPHCYGSQLSAQRFVMFCSRQNSLDLWMLIPYGIS